MKPARRGTARGTPKRAGAENRDRPAKRDAREKRGTAAKRDTAPKRGRDGATVRIREIDSLREELERRTAGLAPARWNADPEEVQRSVARLVLTLIEFLRQLFEKQAIRRMEQGTLTDDETERLGVALMRLEETVRDLAERFGLRPEELNLDLGPLGRLR